MHEDRQPSLSTGQILAYCIYAIPLIATTAAISNFVPPYYSQGFGMPLALVASSLVLIRVIDAICDPLIGLAIDRAKFRQKHRPWLLIALPLYLLATAALFFLPFPKLVSAPYLVLVGSAVYIAFTIGMVVHQAWAAALEDEPRALSRLFGFREVGVIVGVLGVFAFAAIAARLYGSDIAAQAKAAGWFILISITVATLITWAFTPDREGHAEAHHSASWAMLRPFLLSRDFLLLSASILVWNGAWTAMATMGFFVAEHLYHVPQYFALGLVTTFVVAPFGMAFWMKLARRLGDKAALRIACVYLAIAAALLPLLAPLGAAGLFTMQVLMGIGFGAGPYLLRSITGILANAYVVRHGFEVRGAGFAMTNFFDKLGSGLGASALLPLAALGFNPQGAVSAPAGHALLLVATVAPMAGFLLTTLLVHALHTEGAPPA